MKHSKKTLRKLLITRARDKFNRFKYNNLKGKKNVKKTKKIENKKIIGKKCTTEKVL